MTEPKSSEQTRTELDRTYQVLMIFPILGLLCYVIVFCWPHSRENLRRDFEEVFATPLSKDVQVSEYWNALTGHGVRFRMILSSATPLRLKDPASFKELALDSPDANPEGWSPGWFAKKHPSWIATCWYHKQPVLGQEPGPIWVYFNQSKDKAEANAFIASGKIATKQNGDPFTGNLSKVYEFVAQDESYIEYSKKIDHSRIVIHYPGEHDIAVSNKSVDLRLEPNTLYDALIGYLRELESYNGQDRLGHRSVKDKLLNLEIPDGAISDEQVTILNKLAENTKDYNSHLPPGGVPIRLKINVAILGTDALLMLKHGK